MELHRAAGLLDPAQVASKKLVFLGLGSLGSLTAANLAYPWKKIVLVDPEKLAPENVERHLLGKRSLGRAKVDGVADYLIDKGIDPDSIITYEKRAQAKDVLDAHTGADLAIVSIDDLGSLLDINTWCVKNNIPAVYGGVYPCATAGEVMVITNPRDICYLCAAHKMGRDRYRGKVVNYGQGTATDVDKLPVPALHWAISATAAAMADFALEILCVGNPAPQVLIHAHNTWEPIFPVKTEAALNTLSAYILSHPEIGLISNLKLEVEEGSYILKANRAIFSLVLQRWEKCRIH